MVTLHGHLDQPAVERLTLVLRDLIDDQGNGVVVTDLRDVTGVAHSARELFMTASGWAHRHRSTFRLHGPPADLADALLGTWLAQEVDIVPCPALP